VWVGAGKLSCKDGPHGGGNGPRKKESPAGPISAEKEKQPRSGFQGFDFFYFLDLNLDSNLFQIQKNSK
jgi:hypothetical protein